MKAEKKTKKCTKCGDVKPHQDFYKHTSQPCKSCHNSLAKARMEQIKKDPERMQLVWDAGKRWRIKEREELRDSYIRRIVKASGLEPTPENIENRRRCILEKRKKREEYLASIGMTAYKGSEYKKTAYIKESENISAEIRSFYDQMIKDMGDRIQEMEREIAGLHIVDGKRKSYISKLHQYILDKYSETINSKEIWRT